MRRRRRRMHIFQPTPKLRHRNVACATGAAAARFRPCDPHESAKMRQRGAQKMLMYSDPQRRPHLPRLCLLAARIGNASVPHPSSPHAYCSGHPQRGRSVAFKADLLRERTPLDPPARQGGSAPPMPICQAKGRHLLQSTRASRHTDASRSSRSATRSSRPAVLAPLVALWHN